MLDSVWSHITGNIFLIALWWMIIVCIAGILVTRFLAVIQKILIVFYHSTSRNAQWHITIVQTIIWILKVVVWIVIMIMIASRLGFPPSLITALGTVFGAALGFGSQETVRDVVKGSVHLLEKQFSVGDVVSFNISGTDHVGTVEDVTLRTVMVSTESQGIVSVPQGNITVIKNYSRGQGDFLIPLPFNTEESVAPIIQEVEYIVDAADDKGYSILSEYLTDGDIIDISKITSVFVRGVSEVDKGSIVIQIKGEAIPGDQFAAKRALLKAVSGHLDKQGIHFKSSPLVIGGAS